MKTTRSSMLAIIISGITLLSLLLSSNTVKAQCQPFIKIDGKIIISNETVASGVKFPIWLKAGQTVSCGLTVESISIIEFTENGTSLEYSQVLSLSSKTPVSVPTGKVWKIESVLKQPIISGGTNKVEFVMAGTSSFTVPACAEYICIEVWGAGGGGQTGGTGIASYGGGGGAYGQECFVVNPGTTYNVVIGLGGAGGGSSAGSSGTAGGSSSVGSLISAGGGNGGSSSGGLGGTSTAAISVPGFNGSQGVVSRPGGNGGYGGNGGAGGIGTSADQNGPAGSSPGGGGAGGSYYNSIKTGGRGADGQAIIYW